MILPAGTAKVQSSAALKETPSPEVSIAFMQASSHADILAQRQSQSAKSIERARHESVKGRRSVTLDFVRLNVPTKSATTR